MNTTTAAAGPIGRKTEERLRIDADIIIDLLKKQIPTPSQNPRVGFYRKVWEKGWEFRIFSYLKYDLPFCFSLNNEKAESGKYCFPLF